MHSLRATVDIAIVVTAAVNPRRFQIACCRRFDVFSSP